MSQRNPSPARDRLTGKGLCGSVGLDLGPTGARMQGEKIAMPELIRRLSLMLDRSVVDKTGFGGLFDLQLDFVPDDTTPAIPAPPPGAPINGPSLLKALQQQLGLQLESTKGPVQVIVVDHADPPSGNYRGAPRRNCAARLLRDFGKRGLL